MKILTLIAITFLFFLFSSRKEKIIFENKERHYLFKKPTISFFKKNTEKKPLLIALHGYSDFPRLIEAYSFLSFYAEKNNFYVAYPYGTSDPKIGKLSWNAGSCCNPALRENLNDVEFIKAVIDDIKKNHPDVDDTKIYITGFSNGGMLTLKLITEKPEIFDKAAVVGASIGGKINENKDMGYFTLPDMNQSDANTHVSLLIIHGDKDERVQFDGGINNTNDAEFSSFEDTTNYFVKNYNLTEKPEVSNSEIYKKEVYFSDSQKNNQNIKLTSYVIYGGGHTWFGNVWEKIKHPFSKHFETTKVILDFFELD